jgi:hypothetical protein
LYRRRRQRRRSASGRRPAPPKIRGTRLSARGSPAEEGCDE